VRQIIHPGAILQSAKHDWLNWSHDKFGQLDCLSAVTSVNGSV